MRHHGRQWLELTDARRAQYDREAEQLRDEKAKQIMDKVTSALASLAVSRGYAAATAQEKLHKPIILEACQLSQEDIAKWQEDFGLFKKNRSLVKDLREAGEEPPSQCMV